MDVHICQHAYGPEIVHRARPPALPAPHGGGVVALAVGVVALAPGVAVLAVGVAALAVGVAALAAGVAALDAGGVAALGRGQ